MRNAPALAYNASSCRRGIFVDGAMIETTVALYGYAFGDETGEAGFRFERGSSAFFAPDWF
jgi:hypothetical protein